MKYFAKKIYYYKLKLLGKKKLQGFIVKPKKVKVEK